MSHKTQWLYGHHTVRAALKNPDRKVYRLLVGSEALQREFASLELEAELASKRTFEDLLGLQAVHQGVAAQVSPLAVKPLEGLLSEKTETDVLILLDQVTDPHNIGAIMRSAAAFGAKALMIQERHSPSPHNALVAKTASGALEQVALVTPKNLARALVTLKKAGYWIVGLDEKGGTPLSQASLPRPLVLVLGAEGKGVRRLIQKECDLLVSLPTTSAYTTLNVSNAAAIALYVLHVTASMRSA